MEEEKYLEEMNDIYLKGDLLSHQIIIYSFIWIFRIIICFQIFSIIIYFQLFSVIIHNI